MANLGQSGSVDYRDISINMIYSKLGVPLQAEYNLIRDISFGDVKQDIDWAFITNFLSKARLEAHLNDDECEKLLDDVEAKFKRITNMFGSIEQ